MRKRVREIIRMPTPSPTARNTTEMLRMRELVDAMKTCIENISTKNCALNVDI